MAARAIQATAYFFPESTGGTEVYVGDLARDLGRFGCVSTILAPSPDLTAQSYKWHGLPVNRYPCGDAGDRRIISGALPHLGFDRFLALLDQAEPGIYHQHSWSGGCGPHHLRAAKERGLRTVTTVHVPGNVCLSGTMMRMATRACEGRIDEDVCSKCWMVTHKGIPQGIAGPFARISRKAARGETPLLSGLSRFTAAFDMHRDRFELMDRYSDRIVAVCQWLYDALLLNGIAKEKLVLCRQGVGDAPSLVSPRPPRGRGAVLRVGFLGRYYSVKGLDLLMNAMRRVPAALPVELLIHGIANNSTEAHYARSVRKAAAGDRRIQFLPPVARDRIWETLAGFDVLAVPSQWLETGPLVVMEAIAAGTPVLGSDLGGISELVTAGRNGWLVPHDSVDAWAAALERLCGLFGPDLRPVPVRPVRTMRDVAQETSLLYASLLDAARPDAAAFPAA